MEAPNSTATWFKIPGTSIDIPMPAGDLFTALITVGLFLPTVVVVTYLVSFCVKGARDPTLKRD
jgi:hypothetical protein